LQDQQDSTNETSTAGVGAGVGGGGGTNRRRANRVDNNISNVELPTSTSMSVHTRRQQRREVIKQATGTSSETLKQTFDGQSPPLKSDSPYLPTSEARKAVQPMDEKQNSKSQVDDRKTLNPSNPSIAVIRVNPDMLDKAFNV
jgi:hypothetical protein